MFKSPDSFLSFSSCIFASFCCQRQALCPCENTAKLLNEIENETRLPHCIVLLKFTIEMCWLADAKTLPAWDEKQSDDALFRHPAAGPTRAARPLAHHHGRNDDHEDEHDQSEPSSPLGMTNEEHTLLISHDLSLTGQRCERPGRTRTVASFAVEKLKREKLKHTHLNLLNFVLESQS